MAGIFLTRGASLTIPSFRIDLNNPEATAITPLVGYDVYPLWLKAAVAHARASKIAARELDKVWDGSGKPELVELLEQEFLASMQSMVSVAAALDGFYGSVLSRSEPNKSKTTSSKTRPRRARERVILSTFQQKFQIPAKDLASIQKPISQVFEFRRQALHAHGRPEHPVVHPRLKVGMSPKHAIFRSENAEEATKGVLKTIAVLVTRPKKSQKKLRDHCKYAREWIDAIIVDWQSNEGSLGLKTPLEEI